MSEMRKTASYKITAGKNGNLYKFFCDLSSALVCESAEVKGISSEEELSIAWEGYGRKHFNQCRKCGNWVADAMYNPDTLNCVRCSPIEDYPDYCPDCGAKTRDPSNFCHICGAKLFYGGELSDEKAECN